MHSLPCRKDITSGCTDLRGWAQQNITGKELVASGANLGHAGDAVGEVLLFTAYPTVLYNFYLMTVKNKLH